MAAGVGAAYYRYGELTADLIHNNWPSRTGEQLPREFGVSSRDWGVHCPCNASQIYEEPPKPAGTSKRISAYYRKTGNMQNRTEPGFKDTRGPATLTEVYGSHGPVYGTMRQSTRMPQTGAMVISAPPLA